jgi:hypothetical protein
MPQWHPPDLPCDAPLPRRFISARISSESVSESNGGTNRIDTDPDPDTDSDFDQG